MLCLYFAWAKTNFVCVGNTGFQYLRKDLAEFLVVIDQGQDWFAFRPVLTNAKQVLGGRV